MKTETIKSSLTAERKVSWGWIYFVIAAGLIGSYIFNRAAEKYVSWKEVEWHMIRPNAIEKIKIVNRQIAEIYIKPSFAYHSYFKDVMKPYRGSTTRPGPHYLLTVGTAESFERKLDSLQAEVPGINRIEIIYSDDGIGLWEVFYWLLPAIAFFALWRYVIIRSAPAKDLSQQTMHCA